MIHLINTSLRPVQSLPVRRTTWLKNSCSRQSSHGAATAIGRASLEMSLTFTMIFISCRRTIRGENVHAVIERQKVSEGFRRFKVLYHVLVLLVAEVEHRLDGPELVEDLVVLSHVGGQDASAHTQSFHDTQAEDTRK